jgi:hypothetical protein
MNILASLLKLGQRRFVVIALAGGIAASGTMVWTASTAAFTGSTVNPGNSWTTGTVTLTDDDSNAAMFAVTGLVPGAAAVAKCIRVNYTGNVAAAVRLYRTASTDVGATAQYINITIQEGTGTAQHDGDPACGNGDATFTEDANGAIYTGTLANFNANRASYADDDGPGAHLGGVFNATTPWTPSGAATKVYRITYALDAATPDTEQGQVCTLELTWEAKTA